MVKVIGNYVLQEIIGRGQFGEVYKGYHKQSNNLVAIKSIKRKNLDGKCYELLENEIKALLKCNNCVNITTLYDINKTSNNIYLIMEYCEGGDLLHFTNNVKLTELDAIDIFLQILNGFKTLVKNKIIHRDFKLANVLCKRGLIKIADFGFAKILDDDSFTQTLLGSPLNMAPEIIQGKTYNNKVDIWSIGICFYQLLFGETPFKAKNLIELQKTILNKPIEIPSDAKISPQTKDVLLKMLIVDPELRISWSELFAHPIICFRSKQFFLEQQIVYGDNIFKCVMGYFHQKSMINSVHIQEDGILVKRISLNKSSSLQVDQIDAAHKQIEQRIYQQRNYYIYIFESISYLVKQKNKDSHELAKFILKRIISHFSELRKQLQTQLEWKDHETFEFTETLQCYQIGLYFENEIFMMKQLYKYLKQKIGKDRRLGSGSEERNQILKEILMNLIKNNTNKSEFIDNILRMSKIFNPVNFKNDQVISYGKYEKENEEILL